MLIDDGISYANTIIRDSVSDFYAKNTLEAYGNCLDTFARRILEDGTVLTLVNTDEEGKLVPQIVKLEETTALVLFTDKNAMINTDALVIEAYLEDVLDFAQGIGVDEILVDPDDLFLNLTMEAVEKILFLTDKESNFEIIPIVASQDDIDETILPPPQRIEYESDGTPVIPMQYYLEALDFALKNGQNQICFPGGYSHNLDVADEAVACIGSLYAWAGQHMESSMEVTIACINTSVMELYMGIRREINSNRFEEYYRRQSLSNIAFGNQNENQ